MESKNTYPAPKQCQQCQAELVANARFCPQCGSPINNASSVPRATETPAAKSSGREWLFISGAVVLAAFAYVLLTNPTPPPKAAQEKQQVFDHGGMELQATGDVMAILNSLPQDYESLVMQGHDFMDQRNFPLAAECYKRALAIDGTSLDVRVDYGACLHGMDLPQRAKDEFQNVLAENPQHAVANFNLGIVYYSLDQIDSARIYWEKYLSVEPDGQAAATAKQLLQETGG